MRIRELWQRGAAVRAMLVAGVALGIAVVAFAYWTISPLFIRTRVDEAFPVVAATAPASVALAATVMPEPTAMAEPTVQPEATAMPEPTTEPTTPPEPTAIPEPTVVPQPQALLVGEFTQLDQLHGARGSATIYTLPDGSHVLRLEEFVAQNGPDLRVTLSAHADPRTSEALHSLDNYELSVLKASEGNQNYVIPQEIDIATINSVVIYCQAFHVVFSTAPLMAA